MRVDVFSIEGIKGESREYSAPELGEDKRHGKKIDDPMTLGDYRVFEKGRSLYFFSLSWDIVVRLNFLATVFASHIHIDSTLAF